MAHRATYIYKHFGCAVSFELSVHDSCMNNKCTLAIVIRNNSIPRDNIKVGTHTSKEGIWALFCKYPRTCSNKKQKTKLKMNYKICIMKNENCRGGHTFQMSNDFGSALCGH